MSDITKQSLTELVENIKNKKKKKIDENAATFILQGAIDFLNN